MAEVDERMLERRVLGLLEVVVGRLLGLASLVHAHALELRVERADLGDGAVQLRARRRFERVAATGHVAVHAVELLLVLEVGLLRVRLIVGNGVVARQERAEL